MDLQAIRKAITEEIGKLQNVLTALDMGTVKTTRKPRRTMSKAARAKISAAQKKRWAKQKRKAA
jgi:hypothetical protein